MKRIQKIGIYAVCFCLCVACSADSPFDDWGENGTDGGTNPVEVRQFGCFGLHYLTLMFRGRYS